MATTTETTITDEESKVYDRQIRLWGIHAQQKIRSANVLVVGLTGLATEVVKNLVLTGINSITLVDDKEVTNFDMLSNLFTRNQVGMNRALAAKKGVQELNPMVTVNVNDSSLATILADAENAKSFIQQFNVVVLLNHDSKSTVELNKLCSECGVPFFTAGTWGYYAFVFCDLGKNFNGIDFVQFGEALAKKSIKSNKGACDQSKDKRNMARIAKLRSIFATFLTLFKFHEKYGKFPELLSEESREPLIKDLAAVEKELLEELNAVGDKSWTALEGWHSKIFGQFTFISSIVGGLLSQDVIRSVTNEAMETNCFLFDGLNGHNVTIGY